MRDLVLVALIVAVGALAAQLTKLELRSRQPAASGSRFLFPFAGGGPSETVLEAAFRLVRAEGATLVPVYLATVPVPPARPPDAGGRHEEEALLVLETVESRAAEAGVRTDGRVERGRTVRQALAELVAARALGDRVLLGATGVGIGADDVAWALAAGDGELVIVDPVARTT